jgi:ABC-type phosphate/phosphonate transport system ATPase subunit
VVGLKEGQIVFEGATEELTDSIVDAVYGPSD